MKKAFLALLGFFNPLVSTKKSRSFKLSNYITTHIRHITHVNTNFADDSAEPAQLTAQGVGQIVTS